MMIDSSTDHWIICFREEIVHLQFNNIYVYVIVN